MTDRPHKCAGNCVPPVLPTACGLRSRTRPPCGRASPPPACGGSPHPRLAALLPGRRGVPLIDPRNQPERAETATSAFLAACLCPGLNQGEKTRHRPFYEVDFPTADGHQAKTARHVHRHQAEPWPKACRLTYATGQRRPPGAATAWPWPTARRQRARPRVGARAWPLWLTTKNA